MRRMQKLMSLMLLVCTIQKMHASYNSLQAGLAGVQAQLQGAAQQPVQKQQNDQSSEFALKKLDEENHHLTLTALDDYPKYIYELMAILDIKNKLPVVGVRKLIVLYSQSGLMPYRILRTPENPWTSSIRGDDYPPVSEIRFDAPNACAERVIATLKDHQMPGRENLLIWNLESGKLIQDGKKQPSYMPIGFPGPACAQRLIAHSSDGVFRADLATNPDEGDVPELSEEHVVTVRVNSRHFAPLILAKIAEKTEKEVADKKPKTHSSVFSFIRIVGALNAQGAEWFNQMK